MKSMATSLGLSRMGLILLLVTLFLQFVGGTNNWRKKVVKGVRVNEGIWDDCAVEKPGKICYVTKAEGELLSGIQALVLLAAVFEFSNLLISGFIYCLKTALKPFLITIETCSVLFGVAAVILYLHHFIVKAKWYAEWSWILAVVGVSLITVGDIQSIVHFSKTRRAKAAERASKYNELDRGP